MCYRSCSLVLGGTSHRTANGSSKRIETQYESLREPRLNMKVLREPRLSMEVHREPRLNMTF